MRTLVIDSATIQRIMALAGHTTTTGRRRWHGWEATTMDAYSAPYRSNPIFNGPILGLGFVTIGAEHCLVCELTRLQGTGIPATSIRIISLPMFLARGGVLQPASFVEHVKIADGWLSNFITHGVDMRAVTQSLDNFPNATYYQGTVADWSLMNRLFTSTPSRSTPDDFLTPRTQRNEAFSITYVDTATPRTPVGVHEQNRAFTAATMPREGRPVQDSIFDRVLPA